MLQSYISILAEMTVLEEARSTLLSSSQCFRTLCGLLHDTEISVVYATVLLLSRECEEMNECGDLIARCFLEEKMRVEESSLAVLIKILRGDVEIDVKMTILKFLAVLVYSVKSLSLRVNVAMMRDLIVRLSRLITPIISLKCVII